MRMNVNLSNNVRYAEDHSQYLSEPALCVLYLKGSRNVPKTEVKTEHL